MFDYSFENKSVFITGSTGSIGKAIARAFANEGATVSICGRDEERISEIVNEIKRENGKAIGVKVDIADCEDVENAVNHFLNKTDGKLYGIINCAGGSAREHGKELENQSLDLIKEIIDVNLLGTIYCCRECIPHISEGGFIINMASILAYTGRYGHSEYAAAKAGVIGLTKSLAKELGPRRIRVNSISYGSVSRTEETGQERINRMQRNYLNTYAYPDDCAKLPIFLASNEARYITGADIVVDGGRMLALKGTEE